VGLSPRSRSVLLAIKFDRDFSIESAPRLFYTQVKKDCCYFSYRIFNVLPLFRLHADSQPVVTQGQQRIMDDAAADLTAMQLTATAMSVDVPLAIDC